MLITDSQFQAPCYCLTSAQKFKFSLQIVSKGTLAFKLVIFYDPHLLQSSCRVRSICNRTRALHVRLHLIGRNVSNSSKFWRFCGPHSLLRCRDLSNEVEKLLVRCTNTYIKKKASKRNEYIAHTRRIVFQAALCAFRIVRKAPDLISKFYHLILSI